jgi:hypothetical protein
MLRADAYISGVGRLKDHRPVVHGAAFDCGACHLSAPGTGTVKMRSAVIESCTISDQTVDQSDTMVLSSDRSWPKSPYDPRQ